MLLLAAGITSVKHPASRATLFQASAIPLGVAQDRGASQPASAARETASVSEGEVVYRGFSLSSTPLPAFRATDLSTYLRANEKWDVSELSEDGAVLGTVFPPPTADVEPGIKRPAPRTCAALWRNGRLQRLPIPPNSHRIVAGDVNDRGEVAAISIRYRRGKPSYNRVILYRPDASYEDVGTLDTRYEESDTESGAKMRGVSESLLCLNNRGTLLALVGSKSWFRRADGTTGAVGEGIVFDLNNNDTAVGFVGSYTSGAALWHNVTGRSSNTAVPILPVQKSGQQMGGQSYWRGSAECINDKGDTVIAVPIDSASGFRRMGRTAYYLSRGGRLQLIAQMRGYQRSPRTRINSRGDVVGFTDTDAQTQTVLPLLYRDGKMYDISEVAAKSGWKIIGVIDINNKRQMLAYGVRKGFEDTIVPLLLTPG